MAIEWTNYDSGLTSGDFLGYHIEIWRKPTKPRVFQASIFSSTKLLWKGGYIRGLRNAKLEALDMIWSDLERTMEELEAIVAKL